MHQRLPTILGGVLALALLAAACAEDDPHGAFAESMVTTTSTAAPQEQTEVDLAAAADPEAEIEIPDDALDWTGQAEVEVTVEDNYFIQRVILIDPGTRVSWINEGVVSHNVLPAIEGAFVPINTGELEPGQRQVRTFDTAGDFPYYCSLHGTARQGQTGRIIVVEA